MKFNSLKYRILSWFIGIISIVLVLFSSTLYYMLEQSINLRIETNLYHQAMNIYENNFKINNKLSQIAIIKDNKVIKKNKHFTLDINKYIHSDKIFFINEIDEYNVDAIYVLKFKKPYNGAIIIYQQGLSNKAEDIEDTLLVSVPILLLILIFLGSKLIDKVLNPIKDITNITKNISIDNFCTTIAIPKDNDEIKELVISFNNMIKRLEDGTQRMEQFNSDISHELKTPITIIRGELELALKQDRSITQYKDSITASLNQLSNIEQLIHSLLILTKYSKHNINKTFTKIYLDNLLLNIIDNYKSNLQNKNIHLKITKLENITIQANDILINLIISNLLDNAIKYSNNNTNIFISLFTKNNKTYFIIEDEGIGIDQSQISKITDRFYKIDQSRNKSIKGFGLGLSIVKNGIELHNGILQIKSKKHIGTTITIIL